jgi:hypothetical protein
LKSEEKLHKEEISLKFIILEEKYYKEIQKITNLNLRGKPHENQKISQATKLYHQKSGRYKFQKIRPPKDKLLRQIDKLKHRFLSLLLQVYLFEKAPSRKQKRFVFLFRKRKGRQRLKQRERKTSNIIWGNADSNYSNHPIEEKFYSSNEKTCKKSQEQIQGSSFKIEESLQGKFYNSIVYKEFKKTIREAIEISTTKQWKVPSDRKYKETYALLEAE